jgi:hypothetical protein
VSQEEFKQRHRADEHCFVRRRALSFACTLLLVLQKTMRSVQLHLNDFLAQLAGQEWARSVTGAAWTQARAKLKAQAFIEFNQHAILEVVYELPSTFEVRRWRNFRVVAIDSSLLRLPEELGAEFGWVECQNQQGRTGRYAQGRLSTAYDVLNHLGLEAKLVPWKTGERVLAAEHLKSLHPTDLAVTDRGYAGYEWFARQLQVCRHFVCRCEANSFGIVRELFAQNEAGRSVVVKLRSYREQLAALRAAGLPEEIEVRFVTLRLPGGELEVLATSLLDEALYPTDCFYELYRLRWGVETYYEVLKGRLALENFSGRTAEAVRQDLYATVFLSNLETVITRQAQQRLDQISQHRQHPVQVNRAVSFHAIKSHVISLLGSTQPTAEVLRQLEEVFLQKPTSIRSGREVPRKKRSGWISYHYQRTRRKVVF